MKIFKAKQQTKIIYADDKNIIRYRNIYKYFFNIKLYAINRYKIVEKYL